VGLVPIIWIGDASAKFSGQIHPFGPEVWTRAARVLTVLWPFNKVREPAGDPKPANFAGGGNVS
jgi:hypothetical protein